MKRHDIATTSALNEVVAKMDQCFFTLKQFIAPNPETP